MDQEQFTIRGATGVDLALPIAGPGSRSYAFIIDWHIRLLLALAWVLAGVLIVNGGLRWRSTSGTPATTQAFLILLPAAVIYFLYHPILEVFMRGQTPGKRWAGVRVVDREGGAPSTGAILIRNVFRLLDSLPSLYMVGLVATFVSAERVRIGDMAAGTLLVMEEGLGATPFDGFDAIEREPGAGSVDLKTRDLAAQMVERWAGLDIVKRGALARALIKAVDSSGDANRLAAMSDEELRARLVALSTGAPARSSSPP